MNNNKKSKVPAGYLTQNKLAEWLSRDRGTIRRIIADSSLEAKKYGRYEYYRLADVVNAMLEGDRLDLQQERAKLAQRQTERTEIQIDEMKGHLVDAEEVKTAWTNMAAACRAKLLAIPTKMAGEVMALETLQEVQDVLKSQVYEALSELANN